MKPIGIGQLAKAKPKVIARPTMAEPTTPMDTSTPLTSSQTSSNSSSMHDDHDDSLQKVSLERVIPTQDSEEQEGQLSVDMVQNDHELILVAPVAGSTAEQVHVSITDDVITIKGRREFPLKESIDPKNIYLEECFWGNFSRSIILPAAVDLNRVEARVKNNVLVIRIPKTERVRSRVIRIEE